MEPIKFRAWDKLNNKYYEPTYKMNTGELEYLFMGFNGRLAMYNNGQMEDESVFKDRFIVENSTGYQDITGQEIYVGDLIIFFDYNITENVSVNEENTFEVIWIKENGGYYGSEISYKNNEHYHVRIDEVSSEHIHIIGNVNENKFDREYKKRLKKEAIELGNKMDKLNLDLLKTAFRKMSKENKKIILKQRSAMWEYLKVLRDCCKLLDIDLEHEHKGE